MNKEELLAALKEMAETLENDKSTSLANESNEKEQIQIENQVEILNIQIRDLEAKLADDDNYRKFNFIRNHSKIYDLEAKLRKNDEDFVKIDADVLSIQSRLNIVNGEIEVCNELLSEAQRDLDQAGVQFRNLGENPNPEEEKIVRQKMESAREDIEIVRVELNNYIQEREELMANLSNLEKRKSSLPEQKNRYQSLLDNVKKRDQEDSLTSIDIAKKSADERKLAQLKSIVQAYNDREKYISFNFPVEVENLISEIENNQINDEEVLAKLKTFKFMLPTPLTNKYDNLDAEIAENQKLQAEVLMQKTALEDKLSNENNYLPSIFALETINDTISTLENNIARYDADIKNYDAYLISSENQKLNLENDINKLEENKKELASQLETLRINQAILPNDIYEQQKDVIAREKRRIKKKTKRNRKY